MLGDGGMGKAAAEVSGAVSAFEGIQWRGVVVLKV